MSHTITPDLAAEVLTNAPRVVPAVRARVLYITYDGLMEPLGQSQVLQYLLHLAVDHQIMLVSFEKRSDWTDTERRKAIEAEVRVAGIRWVPLRYHRSPVGVAVAYDVAIGFLICAYLVLRHRVKIVHARSYIPAVVALLLKQVFDTRFVFDMRGFWVDERVIAGSWRPGSLLYRTAKWVERRLLTDADAVVSLTYAAVSAMRGFPYLQQRPPHFEVIPTCTNLDLFRPMLNGSLSHEESPAERFTLGYVGSVGTRYLFNLVLECFKTLRGLRPEGRLLILNHGDHAYIREQMHRQRVAASWVEIKAVRYPEVAKELSRVDAGIFFYKPAFSTLATAPTKLGEFLACGIPCLANAGIGDVEELLEGRLVGVVLRETSVQGKERAVKQLLELAANPETRQRCIETARGFSLEKGVRGYARLYRLILGDDDTLHQSLKEAG